MLVDKGVNTEPKKRNSPRQKPQLSVRLHPPPPHVEIIDVDVDTDTTVPGGPISGLQASINTTGRILRSQSVNSQAYWEDTRELAVAFDVFQESTQEELQVEAPPESITSAIIRSFKSSISTICFSHTSSSAVDDSTSALSPRKRTVSDAFPSEKARDDPDIRHCRAKYDAENPFDCRADPVKKVVDHKTPVIIVHHENMVKLFKHRGLSTGVQWELARMVTNRYLKSYEDIDICRLEELRGTSAEAVPKVLGILNSEWRDDDSQFVKAFAKESAHKFPWRELDEEESRFKLNEFSGLGCSRAEMYDGKEFYGGRVHFIAKLKGENGQYTVSLESAELGPSTRFARRFGSAAFIKLAIPKRTTNAKDNKLIEFLTRPFILNGRVFRAFYSKENNVHLKKTNERVVNGLVEPPEDKSDLVDGQGSLIDFLQWHNPMSENLDKTMVKYAARMTLGLSNSVPSVLVPVENMYDLPDVAADGYDPKRKLDSEMDMTDGCGFINASALHEIQERLDLDVFPTAIQVRVCGAKGLLCLDKSGKYEVSAQQPSIGLRPSQIKIKQLKSAGVDDQSFRIIDLLRTSKMSSPSKLSAEIIINLSENGVSDNVFKTLMHYGLDEIFAGLTSWDSGIPNAMAYLWINVAKAGGVISSRLARMAAGEARARGFGQKEEDDDDDDEEEENEDGMVAKLLQRSTAWWSDPISGCPSSLEETVLVLIDSGFKPQSCPIMAEKLSHVLKTALDRYVLKYKIVVPMSCDALIIPDPFGILKPGEVHIKRSRPMPGPNGLDSDIILGDVLVTRHPCKVPSDVQKVKAVQKDLLSQYIDVIVFPIVGKRSLASMLGGGDYDGDRVYAIWQPEIVSEFKNADDKFATAPPAVLEAFEKNTETVSEFLERAPPADIDNHILELQKYLLSGLEGQSLVGQYSLLHDKSVYVFGYDDPHTIYAAYMFCNVLDGAKTGLRVKQDVFKRDMSNKKLYGRPPEWRDPARLMEVDRSMIVDNLVAIRRPKDRAKFIMDFLYAEGRKARDKLLLRYNSKLEGVDDAEDGVLCKPWLDALEWVTQLEHLGTSGSSAHEAAANDLKKIREHVERMREKHRSTIRKAYHSPRKGSPTKGKSSDQSSSFTDKKIEERQDILRALSKEFRSGPSDLQIVTNNVMDVEKIKASYAYIHDREASARSRKKWTRFPWDVAMGSLGEIKAKLSESGLSRTVTMEMYDNKTVNSCVKHIKLFKTT